LDYTKELSDCKNFGDIFNLVKRVVKETLGKSRAGLMLYLADLPLSIGAFHAFGTNGIVLNKKLLEMLGKESKSNKEFNSFVFTLLLHEYLHSLGYVDERQVRDLTHRIVKEKFGEDKSISDIFLKVSKLLLKTFKPYDELIFSPSESEIEIVPNFERENQKYIN
jgi:hypothetical protein